MKSVLRFALPILLALSQTSGLVRANTPTEVVYRGTQAIETVNLQDVVEIPRYEDREVPSTCTRTVPDGTRRVCETHNRRECGPATTREVCGYEDRWSCSPTTRRECTEVGGRECTPVSRRECRQVGGRDCTPVSRRECSPETVCENVSDEVCRTDRDGNRVCTPITRRECRTENNCRDVWDEVCRDTTETVCEDVWDEVCRDTTETVCRDVEDQNCSSTSEWVCHNEVDQDCWDVPEETCRDVPQTREEEYACTRTERVEVGRDLVKKVEAQVQIEMGGLPVGLNEKVEERFLVELKGEQVILRQTKESRLFVFAIQKDLKSENPEPKVTRITGKIRIDFFIAREISNVARAIPAYDLKIQNGVLSFKLQQECAYIDRLCRQVGYPGVTLDPRVFRSTLKLTRKLGGRVILDAAVANTDMKLEYESVQIDLRKQLPDLSTTYTLNLENAYMIRPEFVKSLLNPELLGRQPTQITGKVVGALKPTK